ncbi:MAG TPA: hypothetical protein VHT05_13280 [Candidatus Elarobacter sp.]|jgi:hypothetical protein|nr:hypothetical protein [Candidatus Elarobacter sp.]
MKRSVVTLAAFSTLALSLAACGGSGGGGTLTPTQSPTTAPTNPTGSTRATATISFEVPLVQPNSLGSSSTKRSPRDLSPATDKVSFVVDGTSVFKDVEVDNYNNANGGAGVFNFAGGQSITLSYGVQATYFTVTLALSVLPGHHTFGVVLKSGTPAYVLSEGQASYDLKPGANDLSSSPLALSGVVATGYVSCDTDAENASASPSSCNNWANFTQNGATYTYAFTAVAADYDGFVIPSQTVGAATLPFDNGGFSVVEDASDSPAVVSITQSGAPWTLPGTHLSGPVTGDWSGASKAGNILYGQPFTVTCVNTGTAHLDLQLNGNGGTFSAQPTGSPDNTAADYAPSSVANAILPRGNSGASGPSRVNNVTINCTSTGTITVI